MTSVSNNFINPNNYSGVTSGIYTNPTIQVNGQGLILSASNGSGSSATVANFCNTGATQSITNGNNKILFPTADTNYTNNLSTVSNSSSVFTNTAGVQITVSVSATISINTTSTTGDCCVTFGKSLGRGPFFIFNLPAVLDGTNTNQTFSATFDLATSENFQVLMQPIGTSGLVIGSTSYGSCNYVTIARIA